MQRSPERLVLVGHFSPAESLHSHVVGVLQGDGGHRREPRTPGAFRTLVVLIGEVQTEDGQGSIGGPAEREKLPVS